MNLGIQSKLLIQ